MKHIRTFDEAVNEGFFSWLFKKTYKVNYTAELTDKKTGEPVSYKSYLTVSAKNEEDAEDKFYDKWDSAVKNLESKPKVILGNIKKTDKSDKTTIDLPKSLQKISKDKEVKKEVKKEDKKK